MVVAIFEVGQPDVHNISQDLHGFRRHVHVTIPEDGNIDGCMVEGLHDYVKVRRWFAPNQVDVRSTLTLQPFEYQGKFFRRDGRTRVRVLGDVKVLTEDASEIA